MAAKRKNVPRRSRPTAVSKGAKRVTRRKRTARRRVNPTTAGELMSNHVLLIEYQHAHSKKRTPFVHRFPRKDGEVRMYAMPDGSLRIVGAKRLWNYYHVKDGE